MGSKVYLLVEADKSQCDPLSRLMTQLVDQLKITSVKKEDACCPIKKEDLCYPVNKQEHSCPISSKNDGCSSSIAKIINDKSDLPNNFVHVKCHESSSNQKPSAEAVINTNTDGIRTAIEARACINSSGQPEAKILVCTDKKPSCKKEEEKAPPATPSNICCKRNGLDPTFSELCGQRKFHYLPMKSKIPEYKGEQKCKKSFAITDRVSSASTGSRYSDVYRSKLNPKTIDSLRQQGCAKNVPAARLIKYSACIKRKDGMQDKCDPTSRRALKECCSKFNK